MEPKRSISIYKTKCTHLVQSHLVEQLNPITRFVVDAMPGDHRIPAKKVPDVEPIKHHIHEEHSVEQVACGVKATATVAHCGSSVGR
jgi:hypothetical protein